VAGVVSQFQAQTTRHALVLSAPAEAWAEVDGLRVEQVVANLLDNAVKYSPGGGRIDVTLAPTDPDQFRLTVRDRGLGIPPERRSHIFDLFYQAHVDSHRSGMGIGLYLVRQIVELHGGRVAVAFPADGGTSFRVDLPVGSIEAAPPQNAVGSSS
jgi:signal transduction histidine kinase